MYLRDNSLRLSATDLSNHLHCHHLTQLNLAVARGERERPEGYDPRAEVLRERGFEHEARYLEELGAAGLKVVEAHGADDAARIERTIELMRAGVEVIAQGALADGVWFGRPDVLLRVAGESELGAWRYEVVDTKLARETRGATVLQLCLYSELVETAQGQRPERMHVVSPGEPLVRESLRVADYLAYHRWIQRRLLEAVALGPGAAEPPATYPEPVEHCQVCAYWKECDARRRADDHLSLVAGASRGQRRELEERSIATLARLAEEPIPLGWKPTRGAVATYEKTREQARVQLEGRRRKAPYHELLELAPERGLARLPEPDPADVFFDFEGDAFVGTGGLEYVFGWVTLDERGSPVYDSLWADDAEAEKRAFEHFLDAMIERLEASPGFRIYHFTSYEPAGLKRLMGRYATHEAEVDRLLRAKVFVDLHSVTRQALLASVERYSLKELEPHYGFERALELRDARRALFRVERMLELGQGGEIPAAARAAVLEYNREDCESTLRLRGWLEELRAERVAAGEAIERPKLEEEPEVVKNVKAREQRALAVMERLTEGLCADEGKRTEEERGRWLLAHLADYHWREFKVSVWNRYRLQELSEEQLWEEPAGIAGLEFVEVVEPAAGKGGPLHRYRYPKQEVKFSHGADVREGESSVGRLDAFSARERTVDIRKTSDTAGRHPSAVFMVKIIRPDPKPDSVLTFAETVAEKGWSWRGPGSAGCDLILRRPPRVARTGDREGGAKPVEEIPGETGLDAGKRLVVALDSGVLPVQGPPGSGKTYSGVRMALELARLGKKVGVSAVGHKVVRNFLEATLGAAEKAGQIVKCAHGDNRREGDDEAIVFSRSYPKLRRGLDEGAIHILGGTSWLWANKDLAEAVDVLFIDEAGQMALADVIACARGAKSLVLLGDPQQLDQPQQGSHPEGTHVSALQHLLGEAETLPEGAGLFLDKTYRLHPELCAFTSELFYEGRLEPTPGLENQVLTGPVLTGAGLWYLPVEHDGNQSSSAEEVAAVGTLVERLTDGSTRWTDQAGETAPLRLDQILIVAPYNAQVQALKERLPDPAARIGTVDKFQGQEAPVVIFSTATSSPDLAPRGMEFLYDSSRLNVATSRARSACVLVASPRIFEPECRTPRQIKLANAFCRYLEVGRVSKAETGV